MRSRAADAAEPEIVRRVVAAVEDARTAGRATAALATARRRSGAAPRCRARSATARPGALRSCEPRRRRPPSTASRSSPRRSTIPTAPSFSPRSTRSTRPAARTSSRPDVLDGVFRDAAALAARALAARTALAEHDGPLVRALDDEIDLARRLVIAVLALRHGDRIREAVRVVDHGEGARRALGVEALDVVLSRDEAAVALPLVRRDLTADERRRLRRAAPPRRRGTSGSPTSPTIPRASGARHGSPRAPATPQARPPTPPGVAWG